MYPTEKCYYIFIFQYDKLFSPATKKKRWPFLWQIFRKATPKLFFVNHIQFYIERMEYLLNPKLWKFCLIGIYGEF